MIGTDASVTLRRDVQVMRTIRADREPCAQTAPCLPSIESDMYPRTRLNALTDGLFGVAMTLLVLDIHLPESFHPRDEADFVSAVLGLWRGFFPYLMSFIVLG